MRCSFKATNAAICSREMQLSCSAMTEWQDGGEKEFTCCTAIPLAAQPRLCGQAKQRDERYFEGASRARMTTV